MSHRLPRWIATSAFGLVAVGAAVAVAATGPSSSETPYLVPLAPGVSFTSLLTVGDSVNTRPDGTPYRLVGIPDGMGAFENHRCGTFTLLLNHELGATQGIVRAHGAKGAFVSKWVIDRKTLEVLHGEDLVKSVARWTGSGWDTSTPVTFGRFCSGDLADESAYYDKKTRRGTKERLYLCGEEIGPEGLAYAHTMGGTSYQLPWLGRFSWENAVANPSTGVRTVVVGTDDEATGQVYVYVGEKKATGANPAELAGLTHGVLFGVKVAGYPFELAATGIPSGTPFTLHPFGDVSSTTGAALQTASRAADVTEFRRPEDAAWDPRNPDDLYFVTTDAFAGNSRLWRLAFLDASKPELGGTLDLLLDGSEGQKMFDNMTMNKKGEIFLQEDPGNQDHNAKIWRYDVDDGSLTVLAQHDPVRFEPGGASFLTRDEESSGIIDVSDILGKGTYLVNVQAHYAKTDPELVRGGQLLVMRVDDKCFPKGKGKDAGKDKEKGKSKDCK